VLRTLALRGAVGLEADLEARRASHDFVISVAQGTSGLDLEALKSVRERAWR